MTPNVRKLTLAAHITVSVGWIGAAAVYLMIALAAMRSAEATTWRLAWSVLDLVGWYVLVPMAAIAVLSGIVIALGTSWGLFRHYWVVGSLVLTVLATAVLVRHMFDVTDVARLALRPDAEIEPLLRARFRGEVLHAGLGLLVLLVVEVLNVYKPRGLTALGRKEARAADATGHQDVVVTQPFWVKVVVGHMIAIVVLAGILHAVGGDIRH